MIGFILLILILFILIDYKYRSKTLKQKNKFLSELNQDYDKLNNNLNKTLKNNLLNLKNKKYLKDIHKFDNFYNLPNDIKGLITQKLYDKNYDVIIDNKLPENTFSKLSHQEFTNLIECLNISIDNAIEATKEIKKPFIIIDLYEDKENIFIKIGNNFVSNIDLDNLENKYYTTKKNNFGLGLYSIKKNNYINEKIDIINNVYYITLEMKKYAE